MTSILFQVKNELSGKCRSDRGGRKRRLEEACIYMASDCAYEEIYVFVELERFDQSA